MYRTALRAGARPALAGLRAAAPRRLASTASPANKPRSWKGSAARWGLAGAAVYYYNTSTVFAEEVPAQTIAPPAALASEDLPTVDSIVEEKRKQIKEKLEKDHKAAAKTDAAPTISAAPAENETEASAVAASPVGPAGLEEEAGQQGAFNPETGEINWDCPCLGGMANGPCGEEFKTAFSCFVYSEAEPKGMDCIDKFQGMQECFRQYPEIYGGELTDDDDDAEAPEAPAAPVVSVEEDHQVLKDNGAAQSTATTPSVQESAPAEEDHQVLKESQSPAAAQKSVSDALPAPKPESHDIPQKLHDATAANDEVKEKEESKSE